MVISSRKSSGRGSNKQTNKPLLRRASPFLRLSIFTYDPASIARTVFHTPSSRIVKRISTPTRRKISLVDDKKKKKKKTEEEKFRKVRRNDSHAWWGAILATHRHEIVQSESYARKQRRRSLSSIRFYARSREKRRGRLGGQKPKEVFVHAATSSPTPSFHGPRISPRRTYISYRDLWNLSWDLSPRERGGNTYPLKQDWIGCARGSESRTNLSPDGIPATRLRP